ncbi:MAG: M48 family metalloprotease [Proteobacteria bacterium]|nr:M48 family metalloprotease [Pseudomonadota bacterium]
MRIRSFLIILCLAPAVLAEGLPDLGEISQADFSPQMEKHIGETIMRDIRLHEPSYVFDPEISVYLNRLGARLVSNSTDARQDFEFFVLRDATLNAFAMPGGFIGVHSGLIMAAQSESELASVLAHEISHVTQHHLARQLGAQSQAQLPMLLSLAVAILAARSHSGGDVAQGALMAGQAASIQTQLNYSRDFEREADRLGIQLLERSSFDTRGMASFFERLQKFGRLYENNAPGYLRTHPLTNERIADMENRIQSLPYRQVPDSLDFLLVRAKLKANEGTPQDAVIEFASQLRERKSTSEIATRYGLAIAQSRAGNYAAAEHELAELQRLKASSAMFDSLAADLRKNQKDLAGALTILRPALVRYPQERALTYALVDTLLAAGQPQEALRVCQDDLQMYPSDAYVQGLLAKSYAALGMRLQQHRAQAEVYVLQGLLLEAINQLQFAQKANDGDFYEHSQVDARLRELKIKQAAEAKAKKQEKQDKP